MSAFPSWQPTPSEDSVPFWDSLREGTLRVQQCHDCGRHTFPPMPGCPHCSAEPDQVFWEQVSGRATLYSWVVATYAFHPDFADAVPYVVGLVQLEEGPRVYARVIDVPESQLRMDLPLHATVVDHETFAELCFETANGADHVGGSDG